MAAASPVTPKFILLKWVYIIREEDTNDVSMTSFDVSQVYDEENCYLNDYPGNLKLSEKDARNFGFLIKMGYQIYFKCISSVMRTENNKLYQAGFLCIRVPHTKSFEAVQELVENYDYTYRSLSYFPWPDYLVGYD